jgi:hypothetical protein
VLLPKWPIPSPPSTAITAEALSHLRRLGTVHKLSLWGVEPRPEIVEELLRFRMLTFLEWQIGWEAGRPIASRLEERFPDLLIYSP